MIGPDCFALSQQACSPGRKLRPSARALVSGRKLAPFFTTPLVSLIGDVNSLKLETYAHLVAVAHPSLLSQISLAVG